MAVVPTPPGITGGGGGNVVETEPQRTGKHNKAVAVASLALDGLRQTKVSIPAFLWRSADPELV